MKEEEAILRESKHTVWFQHLALLQVDSKASRVLAREVKVLKNNLRTNRSKARGRFTLYNAAVELIVDLLNVVTDSTLLLLSAHLISSKLKLPLPLEFIESPDKVLASSIRDWIRKAGKSQSPSSTYGSKVAVGAYDGNSNDDVLDNQSSMTYRRLATGMTAINTAVLLRHLLKYCYFEAAVCVDAHRLRFPRR